MRDERISKVEKITLHELDEWENVVTDKSSSIEGVMKFTALRGQLRAASPFSEVRIEHYEEGGGRIVVKEPVVKRKKFLGLI